MHHWNQNGSRDEHQRTFGHRRFLLLIHKVQGEWSTKNVKILSYLHCMKELCKKFTKIEFKHVPRIKNEFADALATLSSMIQHAYCFHGNEEPDGKPWYHDIKKFLATQEYPENATNGQKRALRRLVNHFFLNAEVLYRRTPDIGLLRCVDAAEVTELLEEIHAGTCEPHMNEFTLSKKILRARYFWMTMENHNIHYVQKCHKCQIHGDFIRVPPNELNVMGSPWPFIAWGMDVIGPIETAMSNGHRFILVAIDYFTKCVEASTYKVITKNVVVDFVRNNIVCRFGIPESIITDNAANLNSNLIREIYEKFIIVHHNSTAYRPQINGAVETTMRISTRATPYMLVYDTEAVIPVEVKILSLRVIHEANLDDAEWIRVRQFVLNKIFPHQEEAKGKFPPNWQGPYVFHRALSGGALILVEMDERVSTKPIISDAIKRYYT
ncbi:uncharacterized protein LOC142164060 [Nicotiana tabacum]|uniref:Uncharacterized protein LOC142164060 n=1 Tax=Nicotiana tabacum TaxID=4097 RepID=A0AC58RX39_TOBAC